MINWEAITVGLDWGGRLWTEKADVLRVIKEAYLIYLVISE